MNKLIPKKPALFKCHEEDRLPSVLAGTCRCGHIYFPPHLFGCEACGAGPDALSISEIPAEGRLKAYTAAHLHTRYDGERPLFIGKIVLDNGPEILAPIDVKDEKELKGCEKVTGALIELLANDKGEKIVDLYFKPRGGEK